MKAGIKQNNRRIHDKSEGGDGAYPLFTAEIQPFGALGRLWIVIFPGPGIVGMEEHTRAVFARIEIAFDGAEIEVPEKAHEFAEINFGRAPVAADDEHVLVIVVNGVFAEVGRT